MNRVPFLIILLFSAKVGVCQNPENLRKIAKSYLEYRIQDGKGILVKENILILEMSVFKSDTVWFEVSMAPTSLLSSLHYEKVYDLEGYKVVVTSNSYKSDVFKTLFKELPYENFNKSTLILDIEFNSWRLLLDKNYKAISLESNRPERDILKFLKRNKVSFASRFKFK